MLQISARLIGALMRALCSALTSPEADQLYRDFVSQHSPVVVGPQEAEPETAPPSTDDTWSKFNVFTPDGKSMKMEVTDESLIRSLAEDIARVRAYWCLAF
jgi:hypothetical protein